MQRHASRPIGVTLIAIVLALNGITSLLEAFEFIKLGDGGMLGAVVSSTVGLLILHRAYGIWSLRRGAWLTTLLLLGIKAVSAVGYLVVASPGIWGWIQLALVVATSVYLTLPGVRGLFLEGHNRI